MIVSFEGVPDFGATSILEPNMNCWNIENVFSSVGNSYHIGRMIGKPVSAASLNSVYR